MKVPKPIQASVNLNIGLKDNAEHYLPVNTNIQIPANSPSTYQADEILLFTKDGKGCQGSPNQTQCFQNK